MKKYIKLRVSLLIVSVFLILIILGFAGEVDIASFKGNYTESLVASYSVKGTDPVRKIEYALKYGKPLANFYGINEILSEAKEDSPEITDVRIIMPDGTVAYSLGKENSNVKASEEIRKFAFSGTDYKNGKNYITSGGKYNIIIPIKDRNKVQVGAMNMVLDESALQNKISNYFDGIFKYLLLIILISIAVIVVLFFIAPLIKPTGEINIKVLTLILILVLAAAQAVFGLLNYNLYKKIYIENSKDNTSMVAKVVRRDLNSVIQKNVPIKEMNGVESWLNSIVQSVPEIESLYITDMRGEVFYKTKNLILMQEELIDPMYNYSLPLTRDNLSQKGLVNLVLSKSYIQKRLMDIALDTVTVILTSFIFMTEIIVALQLFLKRRKKRANSIAAPPEAETVQEDTITEVKLIRPIAFAFFFAFSMTTSFIPIVMKSFTTSLQWMPESMKLGLPVSLEVLGTIITTAATGYLIQKKGWRPPFFYGIIIVSIGSVLSGIAWDGITFSISRLITGIGYGFTWMSMRGYVSTYDSENAQNQGFSSLNSGIMSGLNCGVVLGAMIAERVGYQPVFIITVAFILISAAAAFFMIKKNRKAVTVVTNEEQKGVSLKTGIIRLLTDFRVLTFSLLLIIPVSICGMFLSYVFPVSASEMGMSSANIGRAFLVYGLFVVYLGPLFGKYIGSKFNTNRTVIFAGLLCAVSILVFAFGMNTTTAFIAVLILGLSDSFGLAAQGSCFINFDASKRLGGSIPLSVYSLFYKAGQMLGPLAFGGLAVLGTAMGIKIVGFVTIGLIILYVIMNSAVRGNSKAIDKKLEI